MAWSNVGNLKGPKGDKGDNGDKGDKGDAYTLPAATSTSLGGVKVGSGISVSGDGTISVQAGGTGGSSYELPAATSTTLGGIKVGNDLTVSDDGTLSLNTWGWMPNWVDNRLAVCSLDTNIPAIAFDAQSFDKNNRSGYDKLTLKPATASTLGGVKIGAGINIAADGTIDVQELLDRISALETKVAALEAK